MPDGMGAGDLFRSRIMGMGLEDTPFNQGAVGGMMGGMQPEQLMALFQSPQVQQQFKSFGIDPQAMLGQVRQSPFFSNQFLGQHPRLGGFLNRGMASMAATPEAPMVSGAGSGLSRFAQGAYGGPELLRHYQLQQMMGPMGALAGMMPTFGEQRRRAIEEAIVASERRRPEEFEQQLKQREEALQGREREQGMHRPIFDPLGRAWLPSEGQPQQPPQMGPMAGPGALAGVQAPTGPGAPGISPGYRLAPQEQQPTPEMYAQIAQAKETPALAEERRGRGAAGRAAAAKAGPQAYDKKSAEAAEKEKTDRLQALEKFAAPYFVPKDPTGKLGDKEWQQQQQAVKQWLEGQKQSIYDSYDAQIQTAGGQTIPGRAGGGRPGLLSPGAQAGPGQQEDYSATHELRDGPQGYGWYVKGAPAPQAAPAPPR